MNSKIQKTITEFGKTKAKITELQARLSELEAQRVELENTEVIAAFRSVSLAPEEFVEFLRAYTARNKPAAASTFTFNLPLTTHTAVPEPTPEPTPTPTPESELETPSAKSGVNGGTIFFVLLAVGAAGGAPV